MAKEWDEPKLLALVPDTEERTDLEYKSAEGLKDKSRIRKHVSAMANSAGGTIIYGMKEKEITDASGDKKKIPGGLDDVSVTGVSKETLDQIIRGIQPPVNFEIEDVQTPSIGGHVYVVKVVQGITAHMADDNKHYKRINFHVSPMEAYELRMTMNRSQHPALLVRFYYEQFTKVLNIRAGEPTGINNGPRLTAVIKHVGGPLAEKVFLRLVLRRNWVEESTQFNVKESTTENFSTFNAVAKIWEPLFPSQQIEFDVPLPANFWQGEGGGSHSGEFVEYILWADSAQPIEGRLDASNRSTDIKQIDNISQRVQ